MINNKVFKDFNSNKQSISFLQNNSTRNSHLHHRNNSELFLFKNIRNKILYKKIYKNNASNSKYLENKKELFKPHKRNNSFLLYKKNKNNLDLSTIRLYRHKNDNIIDEKNIYKKIDYKMKGNQTSRRDNSYFRKLFQENKDIKKDNQNL